VQRFQMLVESVRIRHGGLRRIFEFAPSLSHKFRILFLNHTQPFESLLFFPITLCLKECLIFLQFSLLQLLDFFGSRFLG